MSRRENPLIVAGATGYARWPSNSLEGARRCLEQAIDGIEIDVQMTADGHVVAHHDYWLAPEATRLDGAWLEGRGPALKTLTLAELRRYDVGALEPGSEQAGRYPLLEPMDGVNIPTLDDLFEVLKTNPGPRQLFYIEIKTDPTRPGASPDAAAAAEAVIAAVEAADYVDHTKIIAFDWRVLRLSRARNPNIATAHLTIPAPLTPRETHPAGGDSPWFDGADPRRHGGSDIAAIKAHGGMEWSPYYTDVTTETVAQAEALGLRVGPWGLSKAADIDRMIGLGVFSITLSGLHWPVR